MIENLPYINEQSFDYNNINNFSLKKQNLMQDNYLNQNLYQELHQPQIIYKEDQQNINLFKIKYIKLVHIICLLFIILIIMKEFLYN